MSKSYDLEVLAQTLYGEARGELNYLEGGIASLIAIGNVVMNRLKQNTWYGKNIEEICKKPQQFSCWNENDKNLQAIMMVTHEKSNSIYEICKDVAEGILYKSWPDLTKGSDHYYSQFLEQTPFWTLGLHPKVKIGHHLFFKVQDHD